MRRNPLLVIATMLAVLVSSFLVFTTLSARAIVENNTSRWQNGVHVVIFLDDRVTSTAYSKFDREIPLIFLNLQRKYRKSYKGDMLFQSLCYKHLKNLKHYSKINQN